MFPVRYRSTVRVRSSVKVPPCTHEALQPHSQHSLVITHDGWYCKTLLVGAGRHPVHFTATQHASELPFVDRSGFISVSKCHHAGMEPYNLTPSIA